jgi:hypothetical protein
MATARLAIAAVTGSVIMSCARQHASLRAGAALPADAPARLEAAGWSKRVGDMPGIWVSESEQRAYLLRGREVLATYACSTATRGLGEAEGSLRTPRGWHVVLDKIGDGMPPGAVFRDRIFTGEIVIARRDDGRDRVLTRIMRLQGLEPGLNAGPGVDSYDRYIYIHGTSAEDRIGSPASAGCIRLCNDDVIELYDRVPSGTLVLITE